MDETAAARYGSEESCRRRLEFFLNTQKKGVAHFYQNPQDPTGFNLSNEVARASRLVKSVIRDKLLGDDPQIKELAKDLAVLALYDMAILIDDSESMTYEENGQRIEILKGVLNIINDIYRHAAEPQTGIREIRFMNNYNDQDRFLGNPYKLIEGHYFGGTTKIGTELHKRILKPLVLGTSAMKKPLLVMVITDGAIEGEKKGLLEKVIINCVNKLNNERPMGADSVAFQFSCIGDDEGARKVLQDLDDHKVVGDYVDCQKATQNLDQSDHRPLTVTKLLLGAIIDTYDKQDDDQELEDIFDSISIDDDNSTGGQSGARNSPRHSLSSIGGNLGDRNNQPPYFQQNFSVSGESNSQNTPSAPVLGGNRANNGHNAHIPQGVSQNQNQGGRNSREHDLEYPVADQFNDHPLGNPFFQPAAPTQSQGPPYPPGSNEGFPYQPEVIPNAGLFNTNLSQPLFQDSTSGYPPGGFNPNQGSQPSDQGYPGLSEAQRVQAEGNNKVRDAHEEARRVLEDAHRVVEQVGRTPPGLSPGRFANMSEEEIAELREEEEMNAANAGGEHIQWLSPDVD